jgi:hypothetical protein
MTTVSFFFDPNTSIKPKRDTKSVGDRSEMRVMLAFIEAGYRIFIPFGENHRVDFLAEDENGRFLRIQVKTGRLRKGVVKFHACSTHSHRGGPQYRRYHGEIDYFGVYCPETETVYLIPEPEARVQPLLRVLPPKNNMKKTIVWADRFVFPPSGQARSELTLWN